MVHRSRIRHLAVWIGFGLALALAATWQAALAFPAPGQPFLGKMPNGQTYNGSDAAANRYYSTISAPLTFTAWKAAYGFDGTPGAETRAVYYNAGDLGFGRDMHCRRQGQDVACYVANHGLGPGGPPEQAVSDAIFGRNALPIVAMVFHHATWLAGAPNDVSFYIYDNNGARLNNVALDSGGDKYLPQLCLPCHGGYYYDSGTTVQVDGANFLPFDMDSFTYSTQAGFTRAAQAEAFRQLNAMVYDTQPYASILQLIDGWYGGSGKVKTADQPFDGDFLPAAYGNSAADGELYREVVKPYCRTCHLAMPLLQFSSPADFDAFNYGASVRADVYSSFIMPHAQVTAHNLWSSNAPAVLARSRAADPASGWAPYVWRVSQTSDRGPSGCASDCALRDAVVDASSNPGLNIIVFEVDGTFTLTEANTPGGLGVDLLEGDLDLMGTIVLLGNGLDRTIIDGNSLDRVLHIHPGADIIIRGVTLRGGSASGPGGGILNEGGKLVLIDSVIRSNASTDSGAGLANTSAGTAEIDRVTIGPGNSAADSGGGLSNQGSGSRLSLSNSTVSGNQAELGGGLYVLGAGSAVTLTHSTLTANSATVAGGGLRVNGGSLVVRSSIVAGNTASASADCLAAAGLASQGRNLFGQSGNAGGCPAALDDVVLAGTISAAIQTSLSGPADRPPVHALVVGSPAVDAIPLGSGCAPPSYDAVDQPRPVDGDLNGAPACDIGAAEAGPPAARLFLPIVRR